MTGYTTDEPIYALVTPFSPSALAVVRTSGNDSIALVSSVFKGRLKDRPSSSAVHGWIVDKEGKKHQQYIRHQKSQNNYIWVEQSTKYCLESKIRWPKGKDLWNDVLKLYIYKKNSNLNPYKKSRALYAETIHEICQKNAYI